jgi:AraC-like DNA-binding protein
VRFQISGALEANTRDGLQGFAPGALFCGPHTRSMPVRVAGGFTSIGISFRPSACTALLGPRVPEYVDRIAPIKDSSAQLLLSSIDQSASAEQWLKALETVLRRVLDLRGPQPEPVTARFEEIAFRNPSMSIAQAARDIGVDRRRLERLVLRDFGLPPKQVLRRARALDMASYLRGVADDAEAAALSLRYYDESHLIHEFTELFGMSPRQFMALPQPLLTLNLEIRQARRLEMIGRIAPGAKRPWE